MPERAKNPKHPIGGCHGERGGWCDHEIVDNVLTDLYTNTKNKTTNSEMTTTLELGARHDQYHKEELDG